MKEKKIATIVLAAACGVTVLCMILGIGLRLAPVHRKKNQNISDIKGGTEKAAGDETVYDSIKTLDLDIDMADVTIIKGSINKVSVNANDKDFLPEISYDGDALVITQSVDGFDDNLRFRDLASFGINNHTSVEITIKDELESLNVDVSLGDINISGITADSFDFDAECGDVDITDCVFGGSAVVDVQLGDLDISETTFENLTVSINLGEVTIDTSGAYKNYAISAETSLGEVNVGGRSFGTNYDSGSGANKIMIHNDLGEIRID